MFGEKARGEGAEENLIAITHQTFAGGGGKSRSRTKPIRTESQGDYILVFVVLKVARCRQPHRGAFDKRRGPIGYLAR